MRNHLGALLLLSTTRQQFTLGYLAPHNPPWEPTFDVKSSLISMQCNSSGMSNATRGAEFGIVSYDWSNNKQTWAAAKPMTCEESLLKQALATKQLQTSKHKHVFVYRNIVKALRWFKAVREKLNDPTYSGFFLKFDPHHQRRHNYHVSPCARENTSKCSLYYHDQEQTPQVPTPDDDPDPDGSCVDYCDCGTVQPAVENTCLIIAMEPCYETLSSRN